MLKQLRVVGSVLGGGILLVALLHLVEINPVLMEESCPWRRKNIKENSHESQSQSSSCALSVECETQSNQISDGGGGTSS